MEDKIRDSVRFYKKLLKLSDSDVKDIKVNLLNNGENHIIYLVNCNNKKFVFRIYFRKELEGSLKKEFEILSKIYPLGPKPIVFDKTKKIIPSSYMIQSFVVGKKLKTWTKPLLKIHANNLFKLHSRNKVKKNGINIYKLFLAKVDLKRKSNPEIFDDKRINEIYLKLNKMFKDNNKLFLDLKNVYLVYGDLHDDNILLEDNKLIYIDWEAADYGDNALDFASLLWFVDLSKSDFDYYLKCYQSNFKDETLKTRAMLWLLFRECSLLLHLKWVSCDPNTRAINKKEDLNKSIQVVYERIKKRIYSL